MEPDRLAVRLPGMDATPMPGLAVPTRREPTAGITHDDAEVWAPAVETFTEFYRASRDRIARALVVTLNDRDLALDAVDEAMARAYQRWATVSKLDNPAGWVYRVAVNWATSRLRRRSRAPQPLADLPVPGIGPIGEPDVMRAIAELDVRQRAVVVCRYLLGWSEAETAAALDTPPGTVKSRLHRATRHLATRLAHLRPEDSEA